MFVWKVLCSCSGEEHRGVVEKNFGGGLEHRKIDEKVVEQHQNISKLERCVVRLYNKYTGKCPKDVDKSSCFYLSPKK